MSTLLTRIHQIEKRLDILDPPKVEWKVSIVCCELQSICPMKIYELNKEEKGKRVYFINGWCQHRYATDKEIQEMDKDGYDHGKYPYDYGRKPTL